MIQCANRRANAGQRCWRANHDDSPPHLVVCGRVVALRLLLSRASVACMSCHPPEGLVQQAELLVTRTDSLVRPLRLSLSLSFCWSVGRVNARYSRLARAIAPRKPTSMASATTLPR